MKMTELLSLQVNLLNFMLSKVPVAINWRANVAAEI